MEENEEIRVDNNGFTMLNKTFSYGIKGKTAHIHMPEMIGNLIQEKGWRYTLEYVGENLFDALQKLASIAENNPQIKEVFAVAPLLSQDIFRERLELLGFRTQRANEMMEAIFPNAKNLYQGTIPIDRLKKVLAIEQKTREAMDNNDRMWHDRILYYKYNKLKEIGIIDYYNVPLNKIVETGKMNYNYRHGIPLEPKRISRDENEGER